MRLFSSAFSEGTAIPADYTCDGRDVSPPLAWDDPPAGTGSFALIVDDPDAPGGTWVHWVAYNIPAHAHGLAENETPAQEAADGMRQGTNSWQRLGYGGPCPPGGTHRYSFRLYALDGPLALAPGATKEDVEHAMAGRVLTEAHLTGRYSRRR